MNRGRRLFFALVPKPSVGNQIGKLQGDLPVSGRAAKSHQFHATLAFLGLQQQDTLPLIREVASQLNFRPCRIVLDRIGEFRRAGVLWLGASEIPEELEGFQSALVSALLDAGIGHDRKPWKLHVTLYRKMRIKSPIMHPMAIEWTVDGFDLIESVSIGNGVEYHSIGHWE
jgi:2'-5' RNA ligase